MDAGLFILYVIVGVVIIIGGIEVRILFANYRMLDKRLRDYMSVADQNENQHMRLVTNQRELIKAADNLKLLMEYLDLEVVDAKRVVRLKQKD